MAVTIGSQLGSYEITALLGKGGFGEVYRAKDKKLKREVAIKILPDEFSSNHDRLTRFQREAEVLASLNHPNIAAIYDLAKQDQSQFLVLELVSGETLADRIARGPIPVEEALNIAKQIVEALEAAHEKGVIHRDLKPANIKITPHGKVKVLDFGLAKIRESSATSKLSNSPTLITAATSGAILGTAAYMSPEQAKGKDADRSTDVWAFGCVLYEMLTGKQAFNGDSIGEILAGILKGEADWSLLPSDTPAGIRKVVRRCLHKESDRRFKHAGDVRLELDEALSEPASKMPDREAVKSGGLIWRVTTALLTLALAIVTTLFLTQRPSPPSELRVDIDTPSTSRPNQFALSPDGQRLAFVAFNGVQTCLWLRSLDQTEAQPLPGTDDASLPFWSPDGRSLGFFVGTKLKRIDIGGGAATELADVVQPSGGTWNSDGVIVFSNALGLFRVPASGGRSVAVTQLTGSQ